jgi:cathepsin L
MKYSTIALSAASLIAGTNAMLPILNEGLTNLFDAYKTQYGHSFDSLVAEEKALLVFIENVEMIQAHNEKFKRGEVSYELSLNQYAHYTFDEFKANMMQYNAPDNYVSGASFTHTAPNMRAGRNLASSGIDWREHGAVTPVKDQGQCGSCWSFSTTGAIEGAHYLATGELVSLSEQQLLNCVHEGSVTCNTGGLMDWGFEYAIKVGGLVTESAMPYKNKYGGSFGTCPYKESYNAGTNVFAASISSYADVATNNEAALASALDHQPVSIAIDASDRSFQFYKSGVYDPSSCCENGRCTMSDLDHGVLAVGYGTDETTGEEYWLVKNSWSASWGDKGYVKMIKGKGSKCGVATAASYPIV